ncbi:hypothetical protein AS888_00010 [Peribacillus simplex]|uniref:Uncharacterized protein n=1 Tax=Peribacillus simplex TaxID=1478 RepID=A0A109N3D2_9BACI|nr:hypothetical protein [Peribacillus simplex]KWW22730.1 hypothetical protein AS888_00010 [Peribacillus simplex]
MIFILESKSSLSMVDYFQILSALGTVVAAFTAMITTLQNRKANKELEFERHIMVKPVFRINLISEMRLEKIIQLEVINIGFNRVMSSIEGGWKGSAGVKVSVKEIRSNDTQRDDLQIQLDFSECIEKNIKGSLSLNYADILGKSFEESVIIEINSVYDELAEVEYPILKEGLISQKFM